MHRRIDRRRRRWALPPASIAVARDTPPMLRGGRSTRGPAFARPGSAGRADGIALETSPEGVTWTCTRPAARPAARAPPRVRRRARRAFARASGGSWRVRCCVSCWIWYYAFARCLAPCGSASRGGAGRTPICGVRVAPPEAAESASLAPLRGARSVRRSRCGRANCPHTRGAHCGRCRASLRFLRSRAHGLPRRRPRECGESSCEHYAAICPRRLTATSKCRRLTLRLWCSVPLPVAIDETILRDPGEREDACGHRRGR